jgi:outer membrane protein assembly factor BamB
MLRTTRCCSALVLFFAACCAPLRISSQTTSFFPVRIAWTESLNRTLSAPPAFSGSSGYFPMAGDQLAAYDLTSGQQSWIAEADVRSRPAIGDDLVFIAGQTAIGARYAADGSHAWSLPLDDPLAVPLIWDNGWLIAATEAGTIMSFRGVDGHLIWQRQMGSPLHAPPALAGDRVYLAESDGRVVALRVETGEPVWERKLGGPPNDILALDDRLYTGSQDNFFYCLNTSDGTVAWRWRTGGDVIGLPIVDERRVYFVSRDNVLRAMARRSGSQLWRRALPLRPTRGPISLLNAIVVSGSGPVMPAYATKDGGLAGELKAGGTVVADPYVVHTSASAQPLLIAVTDDLIKGASITAITHQGKEAETPVARLSDRFITIPIPRLSAWRR